MEIDSADRAALARLGEVIRSIRHARELSQEELAFRAKLDRSYVGGVERGERNASFINVARIARGLGLSIPALFAEFGDFHASKKR